MTTASNEKKQTPLKMTVIIVKNHEPNDRHFFVNVIDVRTNDKGDNIVIDKSKFNKSMEILMPNKEDY